MWENVAEQRVLQLSSIDISDQQRNQFTCSAFQQVRSIFWQSNQARVVDGWRIADLSVDVRCDEVG